ncbi:uncharacterized protein LOC135699440 [Ochlerotatus camptorhynchus]|uniref:uncharacterized protein LOC135699440 n=1 Tax=Ochlerotatus camptorhynchus TaxID=644619 RepID=UPI0031DA0334
MLEPSDVDLSDDDVQQVIRRYFQNATTQSTVQAARIERFGEGSPDGFLADHFALKVIVNVNGSKPEEYSFFLKAVPKGNISLAKYLDEIGSFRKEVALCEKVIPQVQRLITERQVVPRYLLTKNDRLIVMENLKMRGFDILKGNSGLMDYAHLRKALEALAWFHAGSMLLEEKEGRGLMELFPGVLTENAWTGVEGSTRTRDVENVIVLWCEFMRVTERDSSKLEGILAKLPDTIRSLYEYVKSSNKWRNVFSHGDLWSNNVMFKASSSGEPQECILVDFQLSRYTPPAYDINLLLSLTTTFEFRCKHMNLLLDGYYNTFLQVLSGKGIDASTIYTKESFLDSCEYYRLAGQIHGCIIGPEVLLPTTSIDQVFALAVDCAGFMPLPKVNICLNAFRTDESYRIRMLDMVQELLSSVQHDANRSLLVAVRVHGLPCSAVISLLCGQSLRIGYVRSVIANSRPHRMKFLLRGNLSGSSFLGKVCSISGSLARGNGRCDNSLCTVPSVRVSAKNDWRRTRLGTYPKGAAPGHLVISSAAASVLGTRFGTRPLSSRSKSTTAIMVDPVALGLTEEDVELVVKRYLQEKRDKYNAKFRVLSYHVKRLSEEPIGYLGDHYFLNVVLREKMVHYSAEEEEYAEEEYLSFFLKILPEQVPKLADYVREMGCFRKEIQLYTHLIPRLQDVTIGTKPFAPRAYLTKGEKLLVFENLKAEGYQMLENNKSLLDFAHLEVALKTVAKLHAASLVLEERTKQPIMKLYSVHLNENVYIDDDKYVRKTNLDNAIKALCELIKRIDKYKNSDKLDFILEKFPEVIRKIYDFARPSTEYRNVFNHGDLWNNNLMFKYEEPEKTAPNSDPAAGESGADGQPQQQQQQLLSVANGEKRRRKRSDIVRPNPFNFENTPFHECQEPWSCVMIDFQIARYSPPAYDVMSLLNTTTTRAFRAVYMDRLSKLYYEFLRSELEWLQIDVDGVFPGDHYRESCEEYKLAGLIDSILFRHLTLLPADLVSSCKECPVPVSFENLMENCISDMGIKAWDTCENYRFMMADLLSDLIDTYILVN